GLARREDLGDPAQTPAGQIVGTPMYMAPEQARGDTAAMGPATDVYALGVILYELLTGKPPFAGSLGEGIGPGLTRAPVPPAQRCAGLDPALERICLRAMAKEVPQRFPSMAELADALGRFLEGAAPGQPSDAGTAGLATPAAEAPGEAGLTTRL